MKNRNETLNGNPSSNLPIGEWKIGDEDYFISFALRTKPKWFHRVMAKFFFGLQWIDYPQPQQPKIGKGLKVGITKVIERPLKGRHRNHR